MAIEDNTVYGLTGAQVKELPEKIEAVKGLARVLTEADYNYPADNPTSVALWLLEPGLYRRGSGVNVKIMTSIDASSEGVYLVSAPGNRGVPVFHFYYDSHVDGEMAINVYTVTRSTGNGQLRFRLCGPINNLTSTSLSAPLSANQGKVLKDLIDSLVIRGAGAPTTSTVGEVGQLYEDGTNGALYQLKSIDITVTPNTYNWEQVGGGSAYTAGDGIDITNDVISAINTGKARVLTADDYNYPADNPTGVALYLLEPGIYQNNDNTIRTYRYGTDTIVGTFVIGRPSSTSAIIDTYYLDGNVYRDYVVNGQTTRNGKVATVHDIPSVINNLTSTSTTNPLSARQGKDLNDKIGGDLSNLTTTDKSSLINAINELAASAGGGMTELTTADYNYPTNNPSGVALWLLDPGLYYSKDGVYVYRDSLHGSTNSFVALIGEFATERKNILSIEQPWNQAADIRHQTIENSNGNIVSNNMITSLATKAYVAPFSASSAPTSSTAGRLGQIIIDTTDNSAYMCVATSPVYEWKKITA